MSVSFKFKSTASAAALANNTVLQNRYRIVQQLGQGGMGAVYEAVDERLGITVALKETLSSEAAMRKQFEYEARLLANMQHPALPRVSDHFVEGNRAFLVMQFVGGVDLAAIIAQQPGPFPRDQVIAWADQLLDALIYLHSRDRQVIHRDIKPHNLKLTSTGQIALLDFGLAKAQPVDQSSLTASRAFFGYTKHYAPLEQIQDRRTDPRSDIYALGATLYHLLTGTKPPDALVRATALINAEPDPLKPADQIHPAVGPRIAAVLGKAMAQKSEDRFATASDFREALRRIGRSRFDGGDERQEAQAGEAASKHCVVMQMPMVASARRFGPGAITLIVFALGALALVGCYLSGKWPSELMKTAAPTVSSADLSTRPNVATRKPDKPRATNDAPAAQPLKLKVEGLRIEQISKTSGKGSHAQPAGRVMSPQSITPPDKPRRVNVPSIRFPEPDLAETPRLTSFDFGLRENKPAGASPQFFRAPDGTHLVKFADGSTRVIKPGERTSH